MASEPEKPQSGPGGRSRIRGSGKASPSAPATLAGLAIGIAANIGKCFTSHSMVTAGGNWDEVLKVEHRTVEALFEQLAKTGSTQTSMRSLLIAQIRTALGRHAFDEENLVYPQLARALGAELADSLVGQHASITKALHSLGECDKASSEFLDRVDRLRRSLSSHIAEEEILLGELRARFSDQQNADINAARWRRGISVS